MPEPRYPLTVRLTGGRIRHRARQVGIGIVATLCGRRGNLADDGGDRPLCASCANRPNPQDCRSYPEPASGMPRPPAEEAMKGDEYDRGFVPCPECRHPEWIGCHGCLRAVRFAVGDSEGWRLDHIDNVGCLALCPDCRDDAPEGPRPPAEVHGDGSAADIGSTGVPGPHARPEAADCVFCAILREDFPVGLITEWPDAIALHPLNPVVKGHILIIPRAHVEDFASDWHVTSLAAGRAAEFVSRLREPMDFNLITSKGPAATQTVQHLHVHLVPRRAGDGLALPWTGQDTDTAAALDRAHNHEGGTP